MPKLDHLPGRTIRIKEEEYLYFSGTSYLGIAKQPLFQQALWEGLQRYGTNYGGSRLSNIQFPIYHQAEEQLAHITGAPAALTFSSGTLAGQLLARFFKDANCQYAPGTHPASWIPNALPAISKDQWIADIIQQSYQQAQLVIFDNAIDPLYVKPVNFSWLQSLSTHCEVHLILDDSHGLGVKGKRGSGIYQELVLPTHIQLTVFASLGKALGIPGGVILGKETIIQQIKNTPFFGGASPIIPAYLYAFLQSQQLYQDALLKLRNTIQRFTNGSPFLEHFQYIPEYPVFYCPDNTLATYLQQKKIIISSFPYPHPEAPLLSRIVLNSLHTEEDVDYLVEQLEGFSTGD